MWTVDNKRSYLFIQCQILTRQVTPSEIGVHRCLVNSTSNRIDSTRQSHYLYDLKLLNLHFFLTLYKVIIKKYNYKFTIKPI